MKKIYLKSIFAFSGKVFLTFWLIHCCSAAQSQLLIRGKVVDKQTMKPLAFVSIAVKNTTIGTITDTLGKFSIQVRTTNDSLLVSLMGYETQIIKVDDRLEIFLEEQNNQLGEVVIKPGESPADRLVKACVKLKKQYDPEKLASFAFEAYRKVVFSAQSYEADTLKKKSSRKLNKLLKDRALFINETYLSRKFLQPGLLNETILSTKTSGTNSSLISSLFAEVDIFSFYPEFIQIGKNGEYYNFVNPLSQNSPERYDFEIKDTLIGQSDSTFIISFEPKIGKIFDGLRGELHIRAGSLALSYIKAQPTDPYRLLYFTIEQQYEPHQNTYFPIFSHIIWVFKKNRLLPYPLVADNKLFLKKIQVNPLLEKSEFGNLNRKIASDASQKKESFWQEQRSDSLSEKEKNTYRAFENIKGFKKFAFRNAINYAEWRTSGIIPLGKVQIPMVYFVGGNLYEGARWGAGLQTSDKLSERLQVQGNAAYGLKDQAFKWGAGLTFFFDKNRDFKLKTIYKQDVWEPANVDFFSEKSVTVIPYEQVRNFLVTRSDSLRQWKTEFSIPVITHGKVFLGWMHESRKPTYAYAFSHPMLLPEGQMMMMNSQTFRVTEAQVGFRYAFGEQFSQVGKGKILSKPAKYTFLIQIAQGIPKFGGEYEYTKLNAKFETILQSKRFGQTFVNVSAGVSRGIIPYPYLYSGRGSKTSVGSLLWVANHFQTMGLYEFVSDRYTNVFLAHNFGKLLVRPKSQFFQPDISLIQSIGFGSLTQTDHHQKIEINTLEKGFFETGITVDNLLRLRILKLFYLGMGGGVFQRWGAYQLPEKNNNRVFRVVWNVSI